MFFHDIGENIPVLRIITDPFFHGFHRRKGLEAEFGKITETIFPVFGERFISMPYLPEMYIAPVWILRLVKGSS